MDQFKGEIEDFKSLQGIIRHGLEQPFWEKVDGLLKLWANQANDELVKADPKDFGKIAQLQMEIRAYRSLGIKLGMIANEGVVELSKNTLSIPY